MSKMLKYFVEIHGVHCGQHDTYVAALRWATEFCSIPENAPAVVLINLRIEGDSMTHWPLVKELAKMQTESSVALSAQGAEQESR